MKTSLHCQHCSTPFHPTTEEPEFCCAGCRYAHALIHDLKLDRFYDLKQKQSTAPVGERAFSSYDPHWLKAEINSHAPGDPIACHIDGLSCIGCVWLVEKLFQDCVPGGRIELRIADASARLRSNENPEKLVEFAEKIHQLGYRVQSPHGDRNSNSESQRLITRLGVTGGLAMNCMAFSLPRYLGMPGDFQFAKLFDQIAWLSATLALFVGGTWFIQRAWQAVKARRLHIDLPISIGLIAAYLGSLAGWLGGSHQLIYFDFVAIFTTLMLAGRYLQTWALEANRRKLQAESPAPKPVRLCGTEEGLLPPEKIELAQRFMPQRGEVLPVTARLESQEAEASLEWIDGELTPRLFKAGDLLPAGARLLGTQDYEFTATESWNDSLLAGLLAAHAPDERSAATERLLAAYLLIVLLLAAGGSLFWAWHSGWHEALQVGISVLVISCPCALGVSLPLASELASHRARCHGVHVSSNGFWSRLHGIRQVVFDKTGTLTSDLPALANPGALDQLSPLQLDQLAALTQHSTHPFSRRLFEASTSLLGHSPKTPLLELKELPGQGPRALLADGRAISIQAPASDLASPACDLHLTDSPPITVEFHESLRAGAAEAVASSQRQNLAVQILSGDQEASVERIAASLDLTPKQALGKQNPEAKALWIASSHLPTLFLGDGINDSLAIESSTVAGCPASGQGWTKAKVDFYYTHPGLDFLPQLLELRKIHRRACVLAIVFAVGYNAIAIAFCLQGSMTPLLAAVLMPLSSLASLIIVALPFKFQRRDFRVEVLKTSKQS